VRQGLAQHHDLGIIAPLPRQVKDALTRFVAGLAGVALVNEQGHVLLEQPLEFVDEPVGVGAELQVANEHAVHEPRLDMAQGEGGQGPQLHAAHRLAGGHGVEQGATLNEVTAVTGVMRTQQHLALRIDEVAV